MLSTNERSTYVGQWWLPGQPDQIVHGSLEIGQPYPTLELHESIGPDEECLSGQLASPVLHGRSMGASLILLDNREIGSKHGSREGSEDIQRTLAVGTVLVGDAPLRREEGLRFNRASFRLSNLDQWVNRTPYKWVNSPESVQVLDLPTLTASVPGCEIFLARHTLSRRGQLADSGFTSYEVIELELEEWTTLEELEYRYIRPLEQLLSLATGAQCAAFAVHVGGVGESNEWRESWPVRSYIVRRASSDLNQMGPTMVRAQMRFGLNSAGYPPNIDFGVLVPRWYELQNDVSVACDGIFSLYADAGGYLQQQIFTIASAVEALHRGFNPQYEEKTADERARNKEVLAAVKESCPDRHQWLASVIQYAHRKSYLFRGRELLDATDHLMAEVVGDEERWLKCLRDVRDGIGHVLSSSEEFTVDQMVALFTSARLFAETVLLRRLGFSVDECRRSLGHHWELQNVRDRVETAFPEWFTPVTKPSSLT
ncbi:HEPN domain-containing protein [Streptomyces sp. NPDC005773]|uniref:ApeA N-terminal domain 1-containing protein n=1 Tax=Streptomyces sp. NPDC005773 TaxID=3364727 RepID=UPI0036A6EFD3